MKLPSLLLVLGGLAAAQGIETIQVSSSPVDRTAKLPGELEPFQRVAIAARVAGAVEKIEVDRGSEVQAGQLLAVLSAPEMRSQIAAAEAHAEAVEAQRVEALAKVVAAESTYESMKAASATAGAIAANELVLAGKSVEVAKATVAALAKSTAAARASVSALRDLEKYLRIEAPFAGTVTARYVHPGALASPSTGPLVEIEQLSRLRLVVSVPEADAGAIVSGARVTFTVPAHPGRTFNGTIARISRSLDPRTRTMPVEVEVANGGKLLAPGMYADVTWPVRRNQPSLWVTPTAIVTTTERTFVIRAKDGKAEWVNVIRGAKQGDLVEVRGALSAGDRLVKRASDEIREGTRIP